MKSPWVVHEGYLQVKAERVGSPLGSALRQAAPPLAERYVVLTVNRKLEFFDGADPDARSRVDAAHLVGFCGWDGDGLLKADAYGLELKVDKHRGGPRMLLAAFNRLDLEKWCRAFVAVLDPDSAAGQEIKRERRRAKKEEKRLEEERQEKIRKWKEKQARLQEEERLRLLAREEEINNMTPLERVDGLGSLDDDTARLLEKRKLRLQRRQAPTTGRVNKAAYRKRIEEAAGGKTDNVQPLQTKLVEQKSKVRVELPPPGQFIIAADAAHRHRSASSNSGSFSDDGSERSSISSRLSSSSSKAKHHGGHEHRFSMGGFVPPPPPPPPSQSMRRLSTASSVSQFIPPPPPFAPSASGRSSFNDYDNNGDRTRPSRSSSSLRSASFDTMSFDNHPMPRSSATQSRRRMSNMDQEKFDVQSSLAAILGGGRRPPPHSNSTQRRDSFESTASSVAYTPRRRDSRAMDVRSPTSHEGPEPTMANAFAASLAAIRRNRADTIDDSSGVASPVASTTNKTRNRKRDTQLSAEGKNLLKKAIEGDDAPTSKKPQNGRRGLFDDSSSDDGDDSDSGLFGASRKDKPRPDTARRSVDMRRPSMSMNGRKSLGQTALRHDESESDSGESDVSRSTAGAGPSLFARQSNFGGATSPKSVASSGNGFFSSTPQSQSAASVSVTFVSSAVQSVGKKLDGVFTFAFRVPSGLEHSFSYTYAQFEEIHARLTSAFADATLPKFPSKHRLRNNTKPENMQKRAQEFLQYLQQLISVPGMVSSSRFQFEYHIEGPFARALLGESSGSNGTTAAVNGSSKKRETVAPSPTSSRGASPATRREKATKPAKKTLFGESDDSESDSDSDTSINTPESSSHHERQNPQASSRKAPPSSKRLQDPRKHRQLDASQASSHDFSLDVVQARRKSRASSRASQISSSRPASRAVEAPVSAPKVTGLPPNRPNPFAGGRGDLLAAIRNGTELRKTGSAETESSSAPSSTTGVTPPRPPPAAPMTQATSISEAITNAMAARRIHVEYEETHSDGDDSDDDWDD